MPYVDLLLLILYLIFDYPALFIGLSISSYLLGRYLSKGIYCRIIGDIL